MPTETIATVMSKGDAIQLLYFVALEGGYTLLRTKPEDGTPVFQKPNASIQVRRRGDSNSWEFEVDRGSPVTQKNTQ